MLKQEPQTMKERTDAPDRKKEMRLSISDLEADVAYFEARLALLEGEPYSPYQNAQIEVYAALRSVLAGMLQQLRGGRSGQEGVTVDGILLVD